MNDTPANGREEMVLSEISQALNISHNTLLDNCKRGRFKTARKVGPVWVVDVNEVREMLADGRIRPGQPGRPPRSNGHTPQ